MKSTELQAIGVNELLRDLVPSAEVDFVPHIPDWAIKGDPLVQTDVIVDGERRGVSLQGHGVQRAVMISMLQALVPDELSAQAAAGDAGEGNAALAGEVDRLPLLIVGIEEPEIYQHPVRARHFARVLSRWAQRPKSQVVLATHSPYFILPEQFPALRRFELRDGETSVTTTTVEAVALDASTDASKVRQVIDKQIPRTFSEAFFADSVVFVEGDTDRVVLEALAERLGTPLDGVGTAVLAMGGKGNLKVPFALLRRLGIPVYLVADADADAAGRRHPDDPEKRSQAAASHQGATEDLLGWFPRGAAVHGSLPFTWGDDTTVTDGWCLFRDDLESELAEWNGFDAALDAQGEPPRSKNVAAYRAATLDVQLDTLPDSLRRLVEVIGEFR